MDLNALFDHSSRAPRLAGRTLVKVYRYTLSPLVGFHCRHLPTCSDYADQALERHGLWAGGWMTLARLLRCHPFGTSGLDFVPETLPPKCALVSALALRPLARDESAPRSGTGQVSNFKFRSRMTVVNSRMSRFDLLPSSARAYRYRA